MIIHKDTELRTVLKDVFNRSSEFFYDDVILTNDILDFSKIEAGKLDIEAQPTLSAIRPSRRIHFPQSRRHRPRAFHLE